MYELTADELSRFSRHIILPQIGKEGQTKLKNAKVLIIGTGGLGSPIGLYLASAGVGTIGLAEFDTVELHNLQRQILFTESEVGTSKIQNAANRMRALNSNLTCIQHTEGIKPHNAIEVFSQYDIIIDGTDNFPTRYLNNDAAVLAKKPLVYGSVLQFEGQVSVFAPHLGAPCYRCLFPEAPKMGEVPNCAEAGVFGALCGTVGSLQAMETIKLITGIGKPLLNRLLVIDAFSMQFRTINIKSDPECPVCGSSPTITEIKSENYTSTCEITPKSNLTEDAPLKITVSDASDALSLPNPPIIVDVREDYEREICSIEGSINIPLNTLIQNWEELPKDAHILCLCHYGMRSMHAVQFLRDKGLKKVSNIEGGINAWAIEIEPTMHRY